MYLFLTDSLSLLHHIHTYYLLAHTWRQRSKSSWQTTDATCASACFLFSVCRHIPLPPTQTCCSLLIWTRNMNRCDMGNLSTWPRATFGQNRATQLSLKLKSSLGGLTGGFCRQPQRNHLHLKHKGFKAKLFLSPFFPALSLTQTKKAQNRSISVSSHEEKFLLSSNSVNR